MLLEKVVIENFRVIKRLEFAPDRRLTVLVGANGSGKTSVIDALAVGLGVVVGHFPGARSVGFKRGDLQQLPLSRHEPTWRSHSEISRAPFSRVFLHTTEGIRWDTTLFRDKSEKTRKQIPKACGQKDVRQHLDPILDEINDGTEGPPLPIIARYTNSRALPDVPLRRRDFQGHVFPV